MKRRGTEQGIPPNPGYRSTLNSVICTLDLLEFPDLYLGFAFGNAAGRVALNLDVLLILENPKAKHRSGNLAKPRVQISAYWGDLYPVFSVVSLSCTLVLCLLPPNLRYRTRKLGKARVQISSRGNFHCEPPGSK